MRMLLTVVAIGLSVTAGCVGADDGARDRELLVFAAASLIDALEAAEAAFEAAHPEVDVVVHTAGSQRLAVQILEGAPADVFVSADTSQMDRVVAAGEAAGEPAVIARNGLAVAVAPGNPRQVSGVQDLARDDLTVVLADRNVPLGGYTRRLLDGLDLEVSPASLELDARAVVGRVALGEADAGVVYESDLLGRDDVSHVAVPEAVDVTAEYPAVVLEGAGPAADDLIAFLRSAAGVALLRDAGFGAP